MKGDNSSHPQAAADAVLDKAGAVEITAIQYMRMRIGEAQALTPEPEALATSLYGVELHG